MAIDGPAAAGKGTIARALADRFGFKYLDTGLLYRAVGAAVMDGADPVDAAEDLSPEALEAGGLRTAEIGQAASKAAAIPGVRAALFDFQRAFAMRAGGAVLDGRDIGTVICPNAEVKLFVTASDETRAHRRWRELSEAGHAITETDVLSALRERDARDGARATAPLKPAENAVVIDTSELSIAEAVARACALVAAKLEQT